MVLQSGTEQHRFGRNDPERGRAAWVARSGARHMRVRRIRTEWHISATGITERHRVGWIRTGSMEQHQI